MRALFLPAVIIALAAKTWAGVWTTVYEHDEKTPLEAVDPNHPTIYRDIMVGTHLAIVVSSDTGGYWFGSLEMTWEDEPYGALSARGYVPKPPSYKDSCLQAAGERADVLSYLGPRGVGFSFTSTHNYAPPLTIRGAVPGDWFIVDYQAKQAGTCHVALYDLETNWNVPVEQLCFTHVPSRDFNQDAVVDLKDLALLAGRWRSITSLDPNSPDVLLDLNADGFIDLGDLTLFGGYWLERTGGETVGPHSAGSVQD